MLRLYSASHRTRTGTPPDSKLSLDTISVTSPTSASAGANSPASSRTTNLGAVAILLPNSPYQYHSMGLTSPFVFILLRTLLHRPFRQTLSFLSLAHSFAKTPGWGYCHSACPSCSATQPHRPIRTSLRHYLITSPFSHGTKLPPARLHLCGGNFHA